MFHVSFHLLVSLNLNYMQSWNINHSNTFNWISAFHNCIPYTLCSNACPLNSSTIKYGCSHVGFFKPKYKFPHFPQNNASSLIIPCYYTTLIIPCYCTRNGQLWHILEELVIWNWIQYWTLRTVTCLDMGWHAFSSVSLMSYFSLGFWSIYFC